MNIVMSRELKLLVILNIFYLIWSHAMQFNKDTHLLAVYFRRPTSQCFCSWFKCTSCAIKKTPRFAEMQKCQAVISVWFERSETTYALLPHKQTADKWPTEKHSKNSRRALSQWRKPKKISYSNHWPLQSNPSEVYTRREKQNTLALSGFKRRRCRQRSESSVFIFSTTLRCSWWATYLNSEYLTLRVQENREKS